MKVFEVDHMWDETMSNFRHWMAYYRTLKEVSRSVGISSSTLRKTLKGDKPSLISQIKVEEWIKRHATAKIGDP